MALTSVGFGDIVPVGTGWGWLGCFVLKPSISIGPEDFRGSNILQHAAVQKSDMSRWFRFWDNVRPLEIPSSLGPNGTGKNVLKSWQPYHESWDVPAGDTSALAVSWGGSKHPLWPAGSHLSCCCRGRLRHHAHHHHHHQDHEQSLPSSSSASWSEQSSFFVIIILILVIVHAIFVILIFLTALEFLFFDWLGMVGVCDRHLLRYSRRVNNVTSLTVFFLSVPWTQHALLGLGCCRGGKKSFFFFLHLLIIINAILILSIVVMTAIIGIVIHPCPIRILIIVLAVFASFLLPISGCMTDCWTKQLGERNVRS